MSQERFQRGPNYPWKRERSPAKYRPFLSSKESSRRIFQNGSARDRFMGCHDRNLKENKMTAQKIRVFRQEVTVKMLILTKN